MRQPASLVLHQAWDWAGVVVVLGLVGAFLLAARGRRRIPAAAAGSLALLALLLLFATVAAPINQARIGTTVSLQKHVIFGAWYGCILAGFALSRILRFRLLVGVCALAFLFGLAPANAATSSQFYNWPSENPAFVTALKKLVHPGSDKYLIEGYDDIPGYYVGDVNSIQWKEAGSYSYTDPATGAHYSNAAAFAQAIKNRVFTLIILNFTHATPNEPTVDYQIVADILHYGGYKIVAHLPPSDNSSPNYYTVWQVTGGN